MISKLIFDCNFISLYVIIVGIKCTSIIFMNEQCTHIDILTNVLQECTLPVLKKKNSLDTYKVW